MTTTTTTNVATKETVKKTTVKLKFPSQFSKHINHVKNLEFEGDSFTDLLNFLEAHFGKIKERLLDEEKQTLKPYLNVFINKKNLMALDGLNTKLTDGATVSLLLSRAGG